MAERSGPFRRGARTTATLLLALALSVVLAGLAWAQWSAAERVEVPGVITTANVDVQVVGIGDGLAGPGGTVQLTSFRVTRAFPGEGYAEVVTVRNGSSREAMITADVLAGELDPALVTTATFGGAVTGSSCSSGAGPSVEVPAGGTAELCLATVVSDAAPSDAQGITGRLAVTLSATLAGTGWTDEGTIQGGPSTLGELGAPRLSCGELGVLSVALTWTEVPEATGYIVHYGVDGSRTFGASGQSALIPGVVESGTAWVRSKRGEWTSPASNLRTYTIAAVSRCR